MMSQLPTSYMYIRCSAVPLSLCILTLLRELSCVDLEVDLVDGEEYLIGQSRTELPCGYDCTGHCSVGIPVCLGQNLK
jgi:hypothetical protein